MISMEEAVKNLGLDADREFIQMTFPTVEEKLDAAGEAVDAELQELHEEEREVLARRQGCDHHETTGSDSGGET
jgi:Arc/MetJ family transcription regulator